jgi:hypothetical protein
MKYTTQGNCPYCDSERGIITAWGMNPYAMEELKKDHENGHPNNMSNPPNKEISEENCEIYKKTGGHYFTESGSRMCCLSQPTEEEKTQSIRERFNNTFDLDNYGKSHIVNRKVCEWWEDEIDRILKEKREQLTDHILINSHSVKEGKFIWQEDVLKVVDNILQNNNHS